jgi:hypothetical protein
MDFLGALWLPIIVAAIALFIASALAWVLLPHHKGEWRRLSNENEFMETLGKGNPAPGLYAFPYAMDQKQAELPELKAKMAKGPIGYVTLRTPGAVSMAPMMAQSFVFYLIVTLFIAYVAYHAIPARAPYLQVFRVTGTMALMSFAFASVPESIWFARPWKSFALQLVDSVVYALLVAGIFGSLWPR